MNFQESSDLWSYLAQTPKTVVLYGMGNGADKILSVCQRYGVEVADFFASDGFVRGHCFHGKKVLSFSEVTEKYGLENLIVLLSFGSSRPEVLENLDRLDRQCELYAPDVPVCGETLFCRSFYDAHRAEIEQAETLLADEESRLIYREVLAYKLDGKIEHLRRAVSSKDEVYRTLLRAEDIRSFVDFGAYTGDTVRELMSYAPALSEAVAMEPDRRNFRKLSEFAATLTSLRLEAVHAAAWDENTVLSFADSGNRNAGIFAPGKTVETQALSPDFVLGERSVDLMKYDVEGAERHALAGSAETIRRCHPKLLISVYHRSEDLFAIPLQIHAMEPSYRLYLRRYPYVPAWDLNLICL